VFAGAAERFEREQQGRAWQAWHTAALPRFEKFPTLEKLMGVKRQIRAQTPEELEANIRRMFS